MMFLYLLLSLMLMAIVAAQVSIIQTYLLLKNEIAQWWWSSFLIGFGVSFWIFLLSYDYYFFLGQGYGFGSFVIFSGAACWISLAIGMVGGFFSFIGSYFFVRHMYARAGSKVE